MTRALRARRKNKKIIQKLSIFILIFIWIFSGWPRINNFPQKIQEAKADVIPGLVACSANVGGTGAVTPALPSGWKQGDLFLIFVESAKQPSGTPPTGYQAAPSSSQGVGTAASTLATSIEIFWKVAGASESSASITDRGDHTIATMCAFRGVDTSSSPFDTSSGGTNGTASTTATIPGGTTTMDNTLIVIATANDIDAAITARYSAWTNSSLSYLTEIVDYGNASGNGGGFGIATGVKSTAGTYNSTTTTLTAAGVMAAITLALKPVISDNPTAIGCSAGVAGTGAVTATLPTGWQQGDLLLIFVESAKQPSGTPPTGYQAAPSSSQGVGTAASTLATSIEIFWKVAGASESSASITDRGDHTIATMCAFRGVDTSSSPFDTSSGGTNGTASTTATIPGGTTTMDNTLIVIATANDIDAAITARYSAWTNSSLSYLIELMDYGNTSGNGGGFGIAIGVKSTAGTYNSTTTTLSASGVMAAITLALKPAVQVTKETTLGTGIDPVGTYMYSDYQTYQYFDQFSFITNSGSDSVTGITVTTTDTNAIASIQVWNEAETTQYFSTNSSPSGNNWTFSGGTAIPVTTTIGYFRLKFISKTHAVLPAVDYINITGYVSSFTSTNGQTGTDTPTATPFTIDNKAPELTTLSYGYAGNQQIAISFTIPNEPESGLAYSAILRKTGSEVTDTIDYWSDPALNSTIGSSTVIFKGSGSDTYFLNASLTNNTNYYYRIFHAGWDLNWNSGLSIGPYTPTSGGALTVDIVNSSGATVSSPYFDMTGVPFSFSYQTTTGTFGNSNQKIRIENTTTNPMWSLTLAPTNGNTALWTSGSLYYDFNDSENLAVDGSDADSYGGKMTINPSTATIVPKSGCNNTGISLGSESYFLENAIDSITILTSGSSAQTSCYWDITGMGVLQTIPAEQLYGNYSLDMTLTIMAL